MALYIPPSRKPVQHNASQPLGDDEEVKLQNSEWSDSHIRHEFFEKLAKGRLGNHPISLKSHQVEGVERIFNEARGADGNLSPSQALHAIKELHKSRVGLGLDRTTVEAIEDFIISGPGRDA